MRWTKIVAKNGEETLTLNGKYIYSKYQPIEDAKKWIEAEIDFSAKSYLLIGLGLGYHLLALKKMVGDKPITVFCFDRKEKLIFESKRSQIFKNDVELNIVFSLEKVKITKEMQLLLPNVWIKAIGEEHKLFSILETIKIYQQSYRKDSEVLQENFKQNIKNTDEFNYPKKRSEIACLVASGPSLDETIKSLKKISSMVDIYAVGSALKPLLINNIMPKAVVISDAQDDILQQFEGDKYIGDLFYLSTANYKTVRNHEGPSYIVFQEGFNSAEVMANKLGYPVLQTGGSVSTITYSLIEYLGYKKLLLFGLDLGVTKTRTHAKASTSCKPIKHNLKSEVMTNDGTMVYTLPNLRVYLRWFEEKIGDTTLEVYNTAMKGAKISNVPFINVESLFEMN